MNYSRLILLLLLFSSTSINAQDLITFNSYDDINHYIEENSDKPLVINFWATWCAPCVKELPYFEKLHNENPNIKVLTISLDFAKQVDTRLIPFLKKKNYSFSTGYMAEKNFNNWISKIDESWSGSIPATLVINKDKRIFVEKEFDSFVELNEHINQSINK